MHLTWEKRIMENLWHLDFYEENMYDSMNVEDQEYF